MVLNFSARGATGFKLVMLVKHEAKIIAKYGDRMIVWLYLVHICAVRGAAFYIVPY